MKIKVYDEISDKEILEGTYSYIEGGETNGKPSFHFSLEGGEIHFFMEDEELDELIKNLRTLKEKRKI